MHSWFRLCAHGACTLEAHGSDTAGQDEPVGEIRQTLQLSSPSIYSFLVQQFNSYANVGEKKAWHHWVMCTQWIPRRLWWLPAACSCFSLLSACSTGPEIVFNAMDLRQHLGKILSCFVSLLHRLVFLFFSPPSPSLLWHSQAFIFILHDKKEKKKERKTFGLTLTHMQSPHPYGLHAAGSWLPLRTSLSKSIQREIGWHSILSWCLSTPGFHALWFS